MPQSTQSSGFTTGRLINKIDISRTDNTIKSIHSFKPDENFLQTDYNWVLYVKEQIPKELMPYIDRGSINIYVSDILEIQLVRIEMSKDLLMIMVSLIPVKSMKFLLKIIIRQAILIVHVGV